MQPCPVSSTRVPIGRCPTFHFETGSFGVTSCKASRGAHACCESDVGENSCRQSENTQVPSDRAGQTRLAEKSWIWSSQKCLRLNIGRCITSGAILRYFILHSSIHAVHIDPGYDTTSIDITYLPWVGYMQLQTGQVLHHEYGRSSRPPLLAKPIRCCAYPTVSRWPLAGSPDPDDAEHWLAGTVHSCHSDSYLTLVSAELEQLPTHGYVRYRPQLHLRRQLPKFSTCACTT